MPSRNFTAEERESLEFLIYKACGLTGLAGIVCRVPSRDRWRPPTVLQAAPTAKLGARDTY